MGTAVHAGYVFHRVARAGDGIDKRLGADQTRVTYDTVEGYMWSVTHVRH